MLLKTVALGTQSGRVVTTDFLVAETIWPRPNHSRVTEELNWHESFRIVGAHWTQNDECLRLGDSRESKLVIHADRCGSDVEGVLWLGRDPVLLDLNEATAALKHLPAVKGWDSQLQVRLIHPTEVLIRPE